MNRRPYLSTGRPPGAAWRIAFGAPAGEESGSLRVNTRFIINIHSGRAARALPLVRAFAERRGAEIVLTERPRHAAELASAAIANGCDLVVAVGGDGTMNEVASQLVGTGTTLGLVPCGSGDGLGRHLRIHGSIRRALEILDRGRPHSIDTATADGHPFFTAAGLGFEAEIAARFNTLRRRGFLRYLTTSWALWREWVPERYAIEHPAGRDQVTAFTLAVANADQYGNDARIAPGARVDDGLLNLTAIPRVTWANALPLSLRLFAGGIVTAPGVVARTGGSFRVTREQPGRLHTDGEVHDAGREIEFRIRPASLRIMAPPPQANEAGV